MSFYSEAKTVEGAALEMLASLGWEVTTGAGIGEERRTLREVLLSGRLEAALRRLNPEAPKSAIEEAMEILAEDRMGMGLVAANRAVYELLTKGITLAVRDAKTGKEEKRTLRVIDWERPEKNEYLAVSQLRVKGPLYALVPDIVLFVNGLPLVVIELKRQGRRVRDAFDENFPPTSTRRAASRSSLPTMPF